MTVDEIVEFMQINAQVFMLFAFPQFNEYLGGMLMTADEKSAARDFIRSFYGLIDNPNTVSVRGLSIIDNNKLTDRNALLVVLAYCLYPYDDDSGYPHEEEKKHQVLKQFIEDNPSIFHYLSEHLDNIGHLIDRVYSTLHTDFKSLVPWLHHHVDFLEASMKPEFSKFVNSLSKAQQDVVKYYSDNMKTLFEKHHIRIPNRYLTNIEAGVRFDPLNYYLSSIMLLSCPDKGVNDKGIKRLDKFFNVNPQLGCFMAFEAKKLDPIVALWRASQSSNLDNQSTTQSATSSSLSAVNMASELPAMQSSLLTNESSADDKESTKVVLQSDNPKKRNVDQTHSSSSSLVKQLSDAGKVDSKTADDDDDIVINRTNPFADEHSSISVFNMPIKKRPRKKESHKSGDSDPAPDSDITVKN